MVARERVNSEWGKLPIRILNPQTDPVYIHKKTTIGVKEPIPEQEPSVMATVRERLDISEEMRTCCGRGVEEHTDLTFSRGVEEQKNIPT